MIKERPCARDGCVRIAFTFRGEEAQEFCVQCRQPRNPTTGWMMSEYERRGMPMHERDVFIAGLGSGNNSTKIDAWLRRKLGIVVAKKTEERDKNIR